MTSILDKNTGKAFIHVTTIYFLVTILLYKVFNMLQAFLFSFFFALLSSRSERRFPARSRVLLKHINTREIGETCQQKWNFQHQNHDDYDCLITYENETSSTTRLIILVFLNALEHQSTCILYHICIQMVELRIYKVVSSIISHWLSVRVRF